MPSLIGIGALFIVLTVYQFGFLASSYTVSSGFEREGVITVYPDSTTTYDPVAFVEGFAGYHASADLDPFKFKLVNYDVCTADGKWLIADGTCSPKNVPYFTWEVNKNGEMQTCAEAINTGCRLDNGNTEIELAWIGSSSYDLKYMADNKNAFHTEWIANGGTEAGFDEAWADKIDKDPKLNIKYTIQVSVRSKDAVKYDCTPNEKNTDKCQDGTTVVINICDENGQWQGTGDECESGGDWLQNGDTGSDDTDTRDTITCPSPKINNGFGYCICPTNMVMVSQVCYAKHTCQTGYYYDYIGEECVRSEIKVCGNGFCESNETTTTCSADCGTVPVEAVCGNGVCEASEMETCPSTCGEDCGYLIPMDKVDDCEGLSCSNPEFAQANPSVCGGDTTFDFLKYIIENWLAVSLITLGLVGGLLLTFFALDKRRR